jgi:superoxide reductase
MKMGISEYLKTADEGKEKHVPAIDVKECSTCGELSVTIQVGKEVLHPSTVEHSIKTITLYGDKEGKLEQLTVFQLGDQNTVARVRTAVIKGQYKKLVATSYCNLHGLWEGSVDL